MPSRIMASPPSLRMMSWYSMKTEPKSWADEPRMTTKTVEKPRMNINELKSMTRLSCPAFSPVSSSKDIPVTNEM